MPRTGNHSQRREAAHREGEAISIVSSGRYRSQSATVTGDVIIARYADDVIVGFEHETHARRFLDAMREGLEKLALSPHPDQAVLRVLIQSLAAAIDSIER